MKQKGIILFFIVLLFSSVLRFWRLNSIPPALYTDEIDQGYNAYSVLESGRDEHGSLFPLSFRSFGDWKPPLQTYLMVPFVYILGPGEWAVRLPSAILGVFSIVLAFQIAKLIFLNNRIALISAFILSVSPWHLFQSRTAMLVMVALLFFQIGVYGFLKYMHAARFKFLLTGVAGFSLAVYSYYGLRLIAPLTVLALMVWQWRIVKDRWKSFLCAGIAGVLFMSPLVISGIKEKDVLFGRARTVSIFYDRGVELKKWELETQDYKNTPYIFTRIFHNKVILYGRDIMRRYLSHADFNYLFLQGDGVLPFHVPGEGILNFSDVILLPLGLYAVVTKKIKNKKILWIWLLLSILPAALTYLTPASNRTFNAVVPLSYFSASGIFLLAKKGNGRSKAVLISVFLICLYSFSHFLNTYFLVVSKNYADIWGYGWKEVMEYVSKVKDRYNTVYVSGKNGMPYIYYAFYNRIDPETMSRKTVRSYVANEYGFEPVDSFENIYYFRKERTFKDIRENHEPNILVVVPYDEDDLKGKPVKKIDFPDGKPAFNIYEL